MYQMVGSVGFLALVPRYQLFYAWASCFVVVLAYKDYLLVRVSQNSSLLSVINKLFVTFSVVVTQTVQLSDADKELLARWAGMQKNQPKETSTQQHQQATSAAASSTGLVYIQPAPANSSSVGQTKSTSNFSPAHPGSSSTSPTNVHSDYVLAMLRVHFLGLGNFK